MTIPGYLYGTGARLASDLRLKGYQYYQKLLADQIRAQTNGISMAVELHSDLSASRTLKVSAGWAEVPQTGPGVLTSRTRADLTMYEEARLIVHCMDQASGNPEYGIEYSIDDGASWDWLDGMSGPNCVCWPTPAPYIFASPWVTVDLLARVDPWMRLIGQSNEGTAAIRNVKVGIVRIEFRTLYVNQYPTWTFDEYIELAALNGWPPYGDIDPILT